VCPRLKTSKKPARRRQLLVARFMLVICFDIENGGDMFFEGDITQLTFTVLHGVMSQKIELFIAAAVRTSNPTDNFLPLLCLLKV
jgi:hypothetical protein